MNKKEEKTRMPWKRQSKIMELIEKENMVSVRRLSDIFNVSYLTIREDLEKLENKGLLKKVHGGAVLVEKIESEPVFKKQIKLFKNEKEKIAFEASNRINNGDTIIIESGSTGLAMIKHLENKKILM